MIVTSQISKSIIFTITTTQKFNENQVINLNFSPHVVVSHKNTNLHNKLRFNLIEISLRTRYSRLESSFIIKVKVLHSNPSSYTQRRLLTKISHFSSVSVRRKNYTRL